LTVRPLPDLVRRCQRDADGVERKRVLRLLEEVENVLHVAANKSLLERLRRPSVYASVPVFRSSPSPPPPPPLKSAPNERCRSGGALSSSSTSRASDWSSLRSTLKD